LAAAASVVLSRFSRLSRELFDVDRSVDLSDEDDEDATLRVSSVFVSAGAEDDSVEAVASPEPSETPAHPTSKSAHARGEISLGLRGCMQPEHSESPADWQHCPFEWSVKKNGGS
jgi:hypothetical protein